MAFNKKTQKEEALGGPPGDTPGASSTAADSDLQALSAEVVDFLYTQAFSPLEVSTEASICEAFSGILLRHWDLCCIVTFLRAEDGHLSQSAIYVHPPLEQWSALRIGKLMAQVVEGKGAECQVWLDQDEEDDCDEAVSEVRRALAEIELQAGVAVPIHARGVVVGALVAVSSSPALLRAALRGVRFVAAPIIVAIGHARRTDAMHEQRRRIEQLVEAVQQRSAALEEANLELRRVNRYRSLFLARMSHELRTPLTAILGFAEILLDHESLTDPQRRFCQKIQDSGRQLQFSLNQLVDLSRLEAGKMEIFLHEFSVRETLRESGAAVGRLAQKQDVKIECCAASELGPIVSDEGKLRQVLYNFLAHAIGRSPAGGRIKVRASVISPTRFVIEISDEGEQLLDLGHLFDAVDLDAPSESGTNMNELGLIIAHRLIDVLGGRVNLDTSSARGLIVRLDFPTRLTETAKELEV